MGSSKLFFSERQFISLFPFNNFFSIKYKKYLTFFIHIYKKIITYLFNNIFYYNFFFYFKINKNFKNFFFFLGNF